MNRYEKYKQSGIEWIGEIPEHWVVKKLKYIGEAIIGITYSPDDVSNEENGILVLRSSNIQNGKLAFDDCVYVNKEIKEKHLTREGDVLLCARNGSAHLVGKSALIKKEHSNLTFGAFMSIFRSSIGEFAYQFFNSQIFKSQTGLFATSTINQLTTDTLNNLFVPLPPTEEQIAITKYLADKTSNIDILISKKAHLIDLLKKERTLIIDKLIDGTDKSWTKKRLKYLAKMQGGFAFKSEDFVKGGVQLIKISNLYQNEFALERQPTYLPEDYIEKYAAWVISDGDILMSMTGTLGKRDYGYAIQVPKSGSKFLMNQRVSKISFNETEILREFGLKILLGTRYLDQLFLLPTGTKQGNFSNEQVLSIEIEYPSSLKEQQAILSEIVTIERQFDDTILKIESEIGLILEYKIALISEIVTGKQNVI